MNIPEHIKIYFEKIFSEYKRLQTKGYFNLSNLEDYIEELEILKEKLKSGESLFPESEDEDENMMNVMAIINHYVINLPFDSYIRVFGTTKCTNDLVAALNKVRQGTKVSEDVKRFEIFMQKALQYSFVNEGCSLSVSFKLIKTEKNFQELLVHKGLKEITFSPEAFNGRLRYLRVAEKTVSDIKQYGEKGMIREYRRISGRITKGDLKGSIRDFNLWHQVSSKAIYYVYIPSS